MAIDCDIDLLKWKMLLIFIQNKAEILGVCGILHTNQRTISYELFQSLYKLVKKFASSWTTESIDM